jgi:hypothetical protein
MTNATEKAMNKTRRRSRGDRQVSFSVDDETSLTSTYFSHGCRPAQAACFGLIAR